MNVPTKTLIPRYSSSDDNFGWSPVSNKMSSDDENNSSLFEKKSRKKKHQDKLNEQQQNEYSNSETISKKTKKKKSIKEELITSEGEELDHKSPIMREEHSQKKSKKNNIKTEPVDTQTENAPGKTYGNDGSTENEANNYVIIKEESTKKKKKHKLKNSEAIDKMTPKKNKRSNHSLNNSCIEMIDDKSNVHQQINNKDDSDDSSIKNNNNSLNYSNSAEVTISDNEIDNSTEVTRKIKFEKDSTPTNNSDCRNNRVHNSLSSTDKRKDSSSSSSSTTNKLQSKFTPTVEKKNTQKSGSNKKPQSPNQNESANFTTESMIERRKSYPLSKSKKRTSLSERIIFEDDIDRMDSEIEFNENSEEMSYSKKVIKFMERNPQLELVTINENVESIEGQDKVWIVKCPKDFNHNSLKNMNITIDKKFKLKIDGTTFDGFLNENTHRTALLLPRRNKFEIRDIFPKGILTFRNRIPKVDANEIDFIPTRDKFIMLPETKKRHPLFGPKFRKLVHLPQNVMEKLSNTTPRKKLKSKHKNKDKTKQVPYKEEPALADEVDAPSIKNKKKRKHSLVTDEEIYAKKVKHDPEVWDSEQAIENSLFNF